MSIVGGLFRAAGLGSLVDGLEAQGVMKAGDRLLPTTFPEMFIGKEGVSNLGKEGVLDAGAATKALEDAQKDWFKLQPEEWNTKWADSGIAFDPVANKAMMELSDQNVNVKKGIDLAKMPSGEVLGFDEVFNAETLKKAYPDIGNIKIGFLDDPKSPRVAGFDESSDTVYFNRMNPNWTPAETKKIMLHEVQHYVQGKELFTKGEGFDRVLQNNSVYQDSVNLISQAMPKIPTVAQQFAKQNKGLGFTSENVAEALAGFVAKDGMSAEQSLAKEFKSKEMAKKFINAAKNDPKISGLIEAKDLASDAYQQSAKDYMKVAGEVFARQTQERGDMSAAERLANPAMRGIETNPTNKSFGITVDNMTAPQPVPAQQAYADPFASSIPQSSIPQASI